MRKYYVSIEGRINAKQVAVIEADSKEEAIEIFKAGGLNYEIDFGGKNYEINLENFKPYKHKKCHALEITEDIEDINDEKVN